MRRLYWLNTTYACGAVYVRDGVIVRACPIYTRHRGRLWLGLIAELKNEKLWLGDMEIKQCAS